MQSGQRFAATTCPVGCAAWSPGAAFAAKMSKIEMWLKVSCIVLKWKHFRFMLIVPVCMIFQFGKPTVFILYVCSIVLVKTVGRPSEDDPYKEFMDYRFGHIMDSMLTLFILMTCPNIYDCRALIPSVRGGEVFMVLSLLSTQFPCISICYFS